MAKTLKQILDGVKSSKTKSKDILGTKPGVDYSPKAGDERKFADKHHIEKHADRVGNGDDVYNATNVKSYMDTDKATHHGYKSGEDEKVYEAAGKCNMSEAGKLCEVHGMKKCPAKVLNEKPPTKEEVVSELMVQNYVSGPKNKSAEVHKNMNAGNYTVKKMAGGKEVGSSDHDDSASAHAAAKKHLGEDVELEEKAAVAKSKQTVLVTKKGTKSAGGVMRIKKSDYDPKKHDLAEDEEINELSKDTIGRYAGKAHNRGDMAARMSNAGKNKDMAAYANKRHSGVQNAINKLSGRARVNATEDTEIEERKMTSGEIDKREKYVKGMKKKLSDFRARYGERAKSVMYATATKQAMGEDLAQPLIGSMDPTKDKKKKKETESAPAVTPITLPNYSVDVNTGRNV